MANVRLAMKQNLKLIPIINKIDLPSANIESVKRQQRTSWPSQLRRRFRPAAKMGIGIEEIIEAVIRADPSPRDFPDQTVRCLVFDSLFDTYRGVVTYVRCFSGRE